MGDSLRKIGAGIQNKMNSQTIKAIEDLLFIDDTLTFKDMIKNRKMVFMCHILVLLIPKR